MHPPAGVLTVHAPSGWPTGQTAGRVPMLHSHAPGLLAGSPAALQTTTTDVSQQNNTGPLGGPVTTA